MSQGRPESDELCTEFLKWKPKKARKNTLRYCFASFYQIISFFSDQLFIFFKSVILTWPNLCDFLNDASQLESCLLRQNKPLMSRTLNFFIFSL